MNYKARIEHLMKAMEGDFLLFLGNGESPFNYADNTYEFRQDSTFLYLFGIDQPNLAVTIADGTVTLYAERPTMDDLIWTGVVPTLEELAAPAGITHIKSLGKLQDDIAAVRQKGKEVHYVPAYRGETVMTLQSLLGCTAEEVKGGSSLKLVKQMIEMRQVKDADEISEIEKHMAIGRNMHIRAMQMAVEGATEQQIKAAIEYEALKGGGPVSFTTICSVHGETLHNHRWPNTLKKGQLLLVDAGAESPLHYCTDNTRTTPVNGEWTDQQKEIYQIVLDANNAVQAAIEPGIPYLEMHQLACQVIVGGLKELGIMKGDTNDAVEQGAHALFMPHGIGHMMGLDVHDMESYNDTIVGYDDEIKRSTQFGLSALRLGKRLKEGFVVTDEPGIYFIPQLMEKWKAEKICADFINFSALDAYKNFGGIRIEDDLLVTKRGGRLLGERIPVETDDVAKEVKR